MLGVARIRIQSNLNQLLIAIGIFFENPSDEIEYSRFRIQKIILQTQIAFVLSLITNLVFGFWDTLAGEDVVRLMQWRFMVGLPFIAIFLSVSFWPRIQPYMVRLVFVFVLFFVPYLMFQLYLFELSSNYGLSSGSGALNIALALIFALVFFRPPPLMGIFLGLYVLGGYFAAALLLSDIGIYPLSAYMFSLNGIFVAGAFACYMQERNLRQEFLGAKRLSVENEVLEKLLIEIVPHGLANKRKNMNDIVADSFGEVSILFSDLVGFTNLTKRLAPQHLVEILDSIFSEFDALVDTYNVEKVKTIGDAYMVIGGVGEDAGNHVERIVELAERMQEVTKDVSGALGYPLELRIGIHTGSVVGGIIGKRKMAYDYWGDTVNIASRLENSAPKGGIRVSEQTYWRVHDHFDFDAAGEVDLKGVGKMQVFDLSKKTQPVN